MTEMFTASVIRATRAEHSGLGTQTSEFVRSIPAILSAIAHLLQANALLTVQARVLIVSTLNTRRGVGCVCVCVCACVCVCVCVCVISIHAAGIYELQLKGCKC